MTSNQNDTCFNSPKEALFCVKYKSECHSPFNPLLYGRFPHRPKTKVLREVAKLIFEFFLHRGIGNKSWEKSRIFKYGLPLDFFL